MTLLFCHCDCERKRRRKQSIFYAKIALMSNTFGKLFTITTAGESHGPAMLVIIDGCPSGFSLTAQDIQKEVDLRKTGQSQLTSQRQEADTVKILSGVFEDKTTGTPIALMIENNDQRPRDYEEIKDKFRPGHADYTYFKKYGIRDYRGGGRSSARETVLWVAAGAIAKKYLVEILGISIQGSLERVGSIPVARQEEWENYIAELRRQGDSIGAEIQVIAKGVPVGLGEPVFNKLSADIAHAMMSIPAAKGVSIGDGFAVVEQRGSEHRDEMNASGFLSNHAGGVLGGISSGQDIVVNIALKPASSITTPAQTLDTSGNETTIVTKGRHDPCVGFRAVPVAEAMLALVLMDHWLCYRSQKD